MAYMAAPGISTLGIKFGWGAAGDTKPATFTQLTRVNSIGGISIEPEQIDASALEDYLTAYVAGRADTGGSVSITVNATTDTITEWQTVFTASQTAVGNNQAGLWFEVWSPYLTQAFFFVAQTPQQFPMPEIGQNELMTVEIPLTIAEYKGLDAAVEPTGTTGATG
ncbi:MAG: hypothetical protein IJ680_05840 [Paludibacteraceae bacterium]|nr:hypothetical protein [Paludibacteraceae bacterium]